MKKEILRYLYHDQFKKTIRQLDRDDDYTAVAMEQPYRHADKFRNNQSPIPEVSELVLDCRFQRILRPARELAYQTTSNLIVERAEGYHLTLYFEGDFLILLDADTKSCLSKLTSACDSLHILPSKNLFQLLFYYDLRLLDL